MLNLIIITIIVIITAHHYRPQHILILTILSSSQCVHHYVEAETDLYEVGLPQLIAVVIIDQRLRLKIVHRVIVFWTAQHAFFCVRETFRPDIKRKSPLF
jgi:hypothetical protein